jgi:NAD(P)-dependent dehydrogenase (short-subunit alcohol dehydrogenase family)/acyl dehydratase
LTHSPEIIAAEDLRVGRAAEFEREITEADVLEFAANSGDFNPLHVDFAFAGKTRFARRIVHGAFQVGLASALIGMHLPGRDTLLGAVNARFTSPLFFPCRVRVRGEIAAWNAASRTGSLRVAITDLASLAPVSDISMAFTLQGDGREKASSPLPARQPSATAQLKDRRIILLTGPAGGIGAQLLEALAEDFSVLALTYRRSLPNLPEHVFEVQADLEDPSSQAAILQGLGGQLLYGIVHCAWGGMPKGGLLQSDSQLIERQLAFGTSQLVRLAQLIFNHSSSEGGRVVALGSSAGHHKPAFGMGAYSLAKAALEDTVRLLAPELARKKICINAVCPSFVSAGMNAHAQGLQIKREAALVPLGRICETDDIVGTVKYLLSPAASFVTGQSLLLSGGQL